MSPPMKLMLLAGGVLGLDALLIAFVEPEGPGSGPISSATRIGIVLGSMFGQTSLAAVWAALGPGLVVWRLAASLLWVLLMTLCFAVNMGIHGQGNPGFALMMGGCLLGQWTVLQFPLWGMVLGYGLHLRHVGEEGAGISPRDRQFGIRELIILTGIVGVFLGIGRAAVLVFGEDLRSPGDARIFVFLAAAAAILSLPLAVAALLRQYAGRGVLFVLLLTAVLTAGEWTLYTKKLSWGGPLLEHFVGINVVMAAVILAVCAVVRWCGFRLSRNER